MFKSAALWSFIGALYFLSLGIFVSVSLVGVYQALIFLSFIFLCIGESSFLKKSKPLSWYGLVGFFGVNILSYVVNYSTLQNASTGFGYTHLFIVSAMAALLLSSFKENIKILQNLKYSFAALLVTVIIAFAYGMIEKIAHFDLLKMQTTDAVERISGFTDIMRYGYGSGLIVLIVFSILLLRIQIIDSKYGKLVLFAGISAALGVYFAYTRGAVLGLLVAVPVALCFYNKKIGYLFSAVSGLVILVLAVVSLMGGSEKSRFLMKADSASNTIRLSQFEAAYKMFLEHPVLGVGPKQYAYYVKDYKEKYDLPHKDYYGTHSHNLFFETLANTGILGLLSLLFWLLSWAYEVCKSGRESRVIYLPILAYVFVAGQVEMLFMAQTATIVLVAYAAHVAKIENKFLKSNLK